MKMSWIDSGNSVGKLKNKNFNIGIFVHNPYVEFVPVAKMKKILGDHSENRIQQRN